MRVHETCESGQQGTAARKGMWDTRLSIDGPEEEHNYLHGCRVGEASHPGPGSGGAARATACKRAEREEADDPMMGDSGGLAFDIEAHAGEVDPADSHGDLGWGHSGLGGWGAFG